MNMATRLWELKKKKDSYEFFPVAWRWKIEY